MTRSCLSLAAALVAVVLLATPGFAGAVAKAKSSSIVGTLQKVDGQTLTVQTANGPETLTLASNAQIRMGAQTLAKGDLASHTGNRVTIRYTESKGQKEAERVTLRAATQATNGTGKVQPKTTKKQG